MRKIFLICFAILALSSSLSAKDEEAEKIAMQNRKVVQMAAKEISAKLPQKVDDYTQLVSLKAEGEGLVYTFEINTGAKSDKAVIEEDNGRMEKRVTRGICHSSKRFLESGIQISYIYSSAASKQQLFRFDVTRKVCKDILGPAY